MTAKLTVVDSEHLYHELVATSVRWKNNAHVSVLRDSVKLRNTSNNIETTVKNDTCSTLCATDTTYLEMDRLSINELLLLGGRPEKHETNCNAMEKNLRNS